ncbi:unnamed protein product [Penicillium salamii]|uniref:Uncharacterized protein n=1 Tax=Penicillium salamii TaxID=1612424 RepID=A0A9W4NY58_9EURO|nr:unnamed protein product [Penicillium salamii]
MVIAYLDIFDIVSKDWQRILADPLFMRTVAQLVKDLRTRWWAENGRPATWAFLKEQHEGIRDVPYNCEMMSYCKGMLVFLYDDRIVAQSVKTGAQKSFFTENRARNFEVKTSGRLLVRITAEHCHVWDIETEEHKSFPMPSDDYHETLVNGSSVMLYYSSGRIVHFSFTSGIIRTVDLEHPVMVLSLHETGEFSIIDLLMAHEDFRTDVSVGKEELNSYRLQVKRFSFQDHGFRCSLVQRCELSPFLPSWAEGFEFQMLHEFKTAQYCTELEFDGANETNHLHLTLEDDDTIAVYLTGDPPIRDPGRYSVREFLTEQNMLYARNADTLVLGSGRTMVSPTPPGTAFYRFEIFYTFPYDGLEPAVPAILQSDVYKWIGDDDFFVLGLDEEGRFYVASFDDDWKPAGGFAKFEGPSSLL